MNKIGNFTDGFILHTDKDLIRREQVIGMFLRSIQYRRVIHKCGIDDTECVACKDMPWCYYDRMIIAILRLMPSAGGGI